MRVLCREFSIRVTGRFLSGSQQTPPTQIGYLETQNLQIASRNIVGRLLPTEEA